MSTIILIGRYRSDVDKLITMPESEITQLLNFTSNEISYTGMHITSDSLYYIQDGVETEVYNTQDKWNLLDPKYSVVKLETDQEIEDDFATYFNSLFTSTSNYEYDLQLEIDGKNIELVRKSDLVKFEIPNIEISKETYDTLFSDGEIQDYNLTNILYETIRDHGMFNLVVKEINYKILCLGLQTLLSDIVTDGYTRFICNISDSIKCFEIFEDIIQYKGDLIKF